MVEFFLHGGPAMLGVLVCGFTALVAAVRFAIAPDRRKVAAIVSLSVAVVASSLLGLAADIRAVCTRIPQMEQWQKPDVLPIVLLQGLGESLAPMVLGMSLLTVIWLVMAAGHRRLAPRLPA